MGIISFMKNLFTGSPFAESEIIVGFDDNRIWMQRPGKGETSMAWDELVGVAIHTTDEGPFNPDVFWVLKGNSNEIVYPQGATGEPELMKRLQALEGFDNDAVISAMSSVENNTFLCWEKKND